MVHRKKKKPEQNVEIKAEQQDEVSENGFTRDKRARLIVRNLPFANLSVESVRSVFEEFGTVIDVNLLKKSDGKFVGCGFVEYDRRQSAAKAIAKANGRKISGREIVVDWALPKNTFVEKVQQLTSSVKQEPEDSEDKKFDLDLKFNTITQEEDDGEEEDNDDDDEDEDEDDDDEEEDEEDDEEEQQPEQSKKRPVSNDVDEGKTVFIKNVPFSATNDDVKKCVQQFGDVIYALICIDKLTEHSKGSAFVKFKEKSSADACLKSQLFLQDNQLEVTRALSKSQLEEQKKQKKLKTKDSRNLYLVREGVVMAGSPAAVTVSAADMAKRLQIEQWKTQILRNLNMFVSKTRLVIHNLPANYDDAKLKEMVMKYAPKGAVVRECKVMQDRKKFNAQGQAISKEVAFVSFGTHEDALHVLRKINNNPQVFTANRRPIVSFSIENRQILNLKQKRLEKSRAKLDVKNKTDKSMEKLNRKQRRFLRRKEKIIKMRQEAKAKTKPVPNEKASTSSKSNKNPAKKRKREETEPSVDNDEYSGVQSVPGKKLKMRSTMKLKKQAEIHKQRLKEVKKLKKIQKTAVDKKALIRQKEPGMKKGKKTFEPDEKFTKLINSYKQKIESGLKKWYDT